MPPRYDYTHPLLSLGCADVTLWWGRCTRRRRRGCVVDVHGRVGIQYIIDPVGGGHGFCSGLFVRVRRVNVVGDRVILVLVYLGALLRGRLCILKVLFVDFVFTDNLVLVVGEVR